MKGLNKRWLLVAGCWLLVAGHQALADEMMINSNALSQYMVGIRKSLVSIVIKGTPIEKVRFNSPDQLKTLNETEVGIFDPKGGKAQYKTIPAEYMANGKEGYWVFNGELGVRGLGTNKSEIAGYAIGIDKKICQRINENLKSPDKRLAISGIPRLQSDQSSYYQKNMYDDGVKDYQLSQDNQPLLASSKLVGKPFGCFEEYKGNSYVYYHVLIER